MIVEIKEYSFKTGKGIAIDPAGNEIPFSYKELKDRIAIPVGHKAEIVNKVFKRAGIFKKLLFSACKLYKNIRSK